MPYAKTSERREKRLLREQMRSMGLGYRDIKDELAGRYRLRPRAAWREAYGWSLQDTADRINAFRGHVGLDPGGFAGMTAPHLSEYENWPGCGPQSSGRRPTPYLLAVLAAVYDCVVTDLIDLADRERLPAADLLILDKYGDRGPSATESRAAGSHSLNPGGSRAADAGSRTRPMRSAQLGGSPNGSLDKAIGGADGWPAAFWVLAAGTSGGGQFDAGDLMIAAAGKPADRAAGDAGRRVPLPAPCWAADMGDMRRRAADLWRCELDERRAVPGNAEAVTSFTLRWLTARPDAPARQATGQQEVSERDIARIRGVRARLKDIDNAHGGAVAFPFVAAFLRNEVAPLLLASYDERTGRALLEAAAEIELDVGWSAYDAGDHLLARCHFLQALRMAHAAGNRLLGARIVCALSHQALHLGEIGLSTDLARAARAGASHVAMPRATAMLAAMEAMTHAGAGDAEACKEALDDAGRALGGVGAGDDDPGWLDFDEGGLLGHTARAFRDLAAADLAEPKKARQYAERSVELCRAGHGRTRVQRNAILATTFLQAGDVDQAAVIGEQVVADAWNLRSQLVRDDIAALFAGIAPTRSEAVGGFAEQARDLLAAYGLPARKLA